MTIHAFIASILHVPESRVTDESTMNSIAQWDSLKHMELIVALERQYHVELTGDEIAEMTSVAAIRAALARHACR